MSFKQPRLSNFFQSHQNGDDALDKKEFRKSWDSGSNNVHNSNPAVYNPERHSSVSNVSNSYASTHNRFDAFRSGDQNSPHGSTNVTRNSDAAISNPSAKKRRVLPNSIISNLGRETSSKVGAVGAYSNSNYPSLSVGRPPTYSAPQATPKPSPEISADEPLSLSKSQKRVLDAIMTGKSVFFTGAAGTGKSFILNILRQVMEELDKAESITFTAPTGVAACNIRGMTVHSWAGIGRGVEPIDKLAAMVQRNRTACQNWRTAEILVIDEISMLSAELFDKLDAIGRYIRGGSKPFGGIQLVLCGDFFQLPPVGLGRNTHFAFEGSAWKSIFGSADIMIDRNYYDDNDLHKMFGTMILLDKVFRQKDDSTFLNLLQELRQGVVSHTTAQILNRKVMEALQQQYKEQEQARSKDGQEKAETKVKATKLFSINRDVDAYNNAELAKLKVNNDPANPIQEYTFKSIDSGKEPYLTHLRNGTKAPEVLTLKVGAQVMLLKNVATSRGLVNGARGTVVGFVMNDGPDAVRIYPVLPVVKFVTAMGSDDGDGGDGGTQTLHVAPESWDIKNGDDVRAKRTQIPLMLAWAISIHKGMTIPLLEVSFDGMFEYGQGYVALSRAVSLDGLTLRSFSPHAVKAHQTVKVFYESIRERMTDAATNAAVETTVAALVEQFEKYHARDGGDGTVSDASAAAAGGGEDDEGWIDNAPRKALRAAVAAFHSKKIADGISTANANKLPEEADEWLELDGSIIKNEHHQPGSAVAPTMPASAAASVRGCGNIMSPIVKNASAETAGSASSIVNRTQSESTAASAASAVQQPVQLTDEIKLRIERNRLAALERLAQRRQQEQEEAERLRVANGV